MKFFLVPNYASFDELLSQCTAFVFEFSVLLVDMSYPTESFEIDMKDVHLIYDFDAINPSGVSEKWRYEIWFYSKASTDQTSWDVTILSDLILGFCYLYD
jgi:hypothetical protein